MKLNKSNVEQNKIHSSLHDIIFFSKTRWMIFLQRVKMQCYQYFVTSVVTYQHFKNNSRNFLKETFLLKKSFSPGDVIRLKLVEINQKINYNKRYILICHITFVHLLYLDIYIYIYIYIYVYRYIDIGWLKAIQSTFKKNLKSEWFLSEGKA